MLEINQQRETHHHLLLSPKATIGFNPRLWIAQERKKNKMTTQVRLHIVNWISPSFSAEVRTLSYGMDKFGCGKS